MKPINRRRFLTLSACSMAAYTLGGFPIAQAKDLHKITWQGQALGADASLCLYHHDKAQGQAIVQNCLNEINRLEKIFSLFRRDSALVQLNKTGKLENPPPELIEILLSANQVSHHSMGLFDVTVQPLWQLYSRHFAHNTTPNAKDIKHALNRIGWQSLNIKKDMISFHKPEMAITLNGIAQGYITDHITTYLNDEGFDNILVNMGEWRGSGRHPDNRKWALALPSKELVYLEDQAIATSSGQGMRLSSNGAINHLFNPLSGQSADFSSSVSVIAPTAVLADALATALSLCDQDKAQKILTHFAKTTVKYS